MKSVRKSLIGAPLAAALALAGVVLLGGARAGAASPPPWEPDPGATGTINFYNASGNQITSGSLSQPLAAYAAGSSVLRAGDATSALFWFVPTPGVTPANWNGIQVNAFSAYPLTTGPSNIQTLSHTLPVTTEPAGDPLVSDLEAASPQTSTTAGYANVYQIRLKTANPAGLQSTTYADADIMVNDAAGTWTQVYPTPTQTAASTSFSAIQATPASPAPHGSSVTLTSTLSASDSTHPAGTVHLFDGATDKGTATSFVSATGAVSDTLTPTDGAHSYTFKFTPTDTTAYTGTTSAALSYTVNAAASTTTALTVTPPSPSTVGDTLTLKATITPSTATGTVQFKDGSTAIGTPITVSGGVAQTTVSTLTVGTHSLTAVYTPDSGSFTGSTSSATSYVVNPVPATPTTTTLAISPAGPVVQGDPVQLSATVTPSNAAGKVQFFSGSTAEGAAQTVVAGTASLTLTNLPIGTDSLTAKFTPTDSTQFGASTSTPQTLVVTAPPVSPVISLSTTPPNPVTQGTTVTIHASFNPSAATGSIQFKADGTAIGSPITVSGGAAQTTISTLAPGSHSITADYTSDNTSAFLNTSASAVTVVVAAVTTTSLAVPAGPVEAGTAVALTATVTPSNAVGTVKFLDGAAQIGTATLSSGTATVTVSTLAVGTRHLTAQFVPMDLSEFTASTSAVQTLVVTAPPVTPVITLSTTPPNPVTQGTTVTIHASFNPTAATGSIQFKADGTAIGSPITVSGGAAQTTISTLTPGSHSITADYTSDDTSAFVNTSASAVTVVVAAVTTTSLAVPAGPVDFGTAVALKATVTPSNAVGTVKFFDGSTQLGSTVAVSSGAATLSVTTLTSGSHQLKAQFVPTDASQFTASTSAVQTLVVNKPPAAATTTTLTMAPSPIASKGNTVKLTATVALTGPTGGRTAAVGSVEFFDGTTSLGTSAVSGGKATLSVSSLTIGDHQLTATFTPADATDFVTSTSAAVTLTIKEPAVLGTVTIDGQPAGNDPTLKAGDTVDLSGTGFIPDESVDVVLRSTPVTLTTVHADGSGAVAASVTIPTGLPAGTHTLTLQGAADATVFTFTIAAVSTSTSATSSASASATSSESGAAVSGSSAASGSNGSSSGVLASTGAQIAGATLLALMLVGGGAALLIVSRRRRQRTDGPRHG